MTWSQRSSMVSTYLRYGRRVPDPGYYNRPLIPKRLSFFYSAFWDLDTERPRAMGGEGPIPMSAVRSFARDHGLDPELAERLKLIVKAMDRVYLTVKSEQQREAQENAKRQAEQDRAEREAAKVVSRTPEDD